MSNFNFRKKYILLFFLMLLFLAIFFYINSIEQNQGSKIEFKMLYVVLHDHQNVKILDKTPFEKKLREFNKIIEEETFGIINSQAKLKFLNIEEIGDKKLQYDKRDVHDWQEKINEKLNSKYDYNILVFSPLEDISWCSDAGRSQGFNIDGLVYFCLENSFPYLEESDKNKIKNPHPEEGLWLTVHKTFHGFGFHHASWNYKQLTLIDGRQEGLPDRGRGEHSLFSNYILKALGKLPKDDFNEKCHWNGWFECKNSKKWKNTCRTAYGSYCFDADGDGVVDLKDPYPFSSPVEGKDSTGDGIVDELDLCPWNKITVEGSKNPYNKLKLVVKNIDQTTLSFSSPNQINKIKIMDGKRLPGGTTFEFINERTIESTTIQGQDLNPTDKNLRAPIWRVEVYYEYEEKDYYRPFFLYKAPFHEEFEYLYEKEWIYFSRFGCDIPTEIDLLDKDTYDQNRDGLPDQDKFSFAQKIDENYDWSDDGLPDIRDPLPTIKDGCKKTPEGYQCIRSPFKSNRTHHLHDHFRDPYEIEKKFFMPENSINSLDSVPINYTF